MITIVFTNKIKAASTAQWTSQPIILMHFTVWLYLPKRMVIGPVIRAPVRPPNEKMETMTVQIRVTW